MDCGNQLPQDSSDNIYAVLLNRFHSLQASHEKLTEQFNVLRQEKKSINEEAGCSTSNGGALLVKKLVGKAAGRNVLEDYSSAEDSHWDRYLPGAHFVGDGYKNILDCMGHALHITRAGSEEIIYWNLSAEKLYGYKDYEVLGQRDAELIIDEKYHALARKIKDILSYGRSWEGQFPLKKRSGQIFIALVTKSLLYEDCELVGTITVSSDAAVFNNQHLENLRICEDPDDGKSRGRGIDLKRLQFRGRPQIASSISNLASKVFPRKLEDSGSDDLDNAYKKSERPCRTPGKIDGDGFESEESTSEFPQPLRLAEKVLAKLHIGKNKDVTVQQKSSNGTSFSNVLVEPSSLGTSRSITSHYGIFDVNEDDEYVEGFSRRPQAISNYLKEDSYVINAPVRVSKDLKPNVEIVEIEDSLPFPPDTQRFPNSREDGRSGIGIRLSKGDNQPNLSEHCEIHWEDLQLGDQIGQGSFAVVYHGIWNGSDVAVKVYFGNEYNDQTLLGYNKELDIMRRLRHPNVLLFMGAVCSREKLALVTEFLPRGSLFKALHKSNQQLDIKRRLSMALDVARGMNYLHRRNPPIVHRDLKTSNLLVDKSWNVKVGDFGLSKLKEATFLTTRSGKGTPQWMAPEVLRNEPSTEKSDIYSFGVILWELMTECIPWKDLNPLQVVGVVSFMDRRLDLPANLHPGISSIIHDCWHSKPEVRPSFQDIIRRMTDLIQTFTVVNGKKIPRP